MCASGLGAGGPVYFILKAHPRQMQKNQGCASCVVVCGRKRILQTICGYCTKVVSNGPAATGT